MGYQQDVDRALAVAGNQGRYQVIIMVFLCILFYFGMFLSLGPSFYLMDPNFICEGSDDIVNQYEACPKIEECRITNDYTITSQMGLYCDRQNERNLIQSILSVGSFLGLVFMNFLADLRGRKFALIIDLLLGSLSCFLTLIGAYTQNTILLCFGSIIAGFSGFSGVIVSYIIAADICQEQMRQKSSLYMNLSASIALITFFFLYNWMNQWQNFLILFMFLPFLGLSVIFLILLQQSPNYFLCRKKDKKKCIQALTNIAFYNQKNSAQVQEIERIINKSEQSQEQLKLTQQKSSVWTSLKKWKYLKIIICMSFVKSGASLFFIGIQYAVNDIGFNYGVNNLVIGATQIIVTLIMIPIVSKLPRKKTMFIFYIATIIFSFIFLIDFVQKSSIFCTILIIGIRASTTIGYFMMVMVQTQSFPLQIQSIGAGSIQGIGQAGSFSAPLIISFATNHQFQKMATLGVVLSGLLIPLVFVPEPRSKIKKQKGNESLLQSVVESQGTDNSIQ